MTAAVAERFQTFLKQEVATFSIIVDNAARNTITSMQGDVVHCQLTVQERLQQWAGQGNAQCCPSGSWGCPFQGRGIRAPDLKILWRSMCAIVVWKCWN